MAGRDTVWIKEEQSPKRCVDRELYESFGLGKAPDFDTIDEEIQSWVGKKEFTSLEDVSEFVNEIVARHKDAQQWN